MNKKTILTLIIIIGVVLAIGLYSKSNKTEKAPEPKKTETAHTPTPPVLATTPDTVADSGYSLLGVWYDETIKSEQGGKIVYEIVTNGKQIYIQAMSFKGEDLKVSDTPKLLPEASEITKKDADYVSVDNKNTVFKVDEEGNLLIYDHKKLIVKCKKIL